MNDAPGINKSFVVTKLTSLETARAFHASCVIGDKVYLHGGTRSYKGGEEPLNDIVVFDTSTKCAAAIKTKSQGPSRSHHTCVALNDVLICIVGGWDGKKRTNDVWLFDVRKSEWTELKPEPKSDPPAGLSSHTCTLMNDNQMIVTGREGDVRMQRRFGSVFTLTVNVKKSTCLFQPYPKNIASRSGHTASIFGVGKNNTGKIMIIGGRDSNNVENLTLDLLQCTKSGHEISEAVEERILSLAETSKPIKLTSVKSHAVLNGKSLVLTHGGEEFGRMRDTITSSIICYDKKAVNCKKLDYLKDKDDDDPDMNRMGHSFVCLHNELYIIGGMTHLNKDPSPVVVNIKIGFGS